MAFFAESNDKKTIKVIVRADDALDNVTDEVYEEYLQTLDESTLKFVEGKEPTRFVMRLRLPWNVDQDIQNQQVKVSKKGEVQPQIAYIMEELRAAIIDIENPHDVPAIIYKNDNDGMCHKNIVLLLKEHNLHWDLYNARQNQLVGKKKVTDEVKKKLAHS